MRQQANADTMLVLDPSRIGELQWQPVTGCPGVHEKELWRSGEVVHALIRYEQGSRTPGKPHHVADHHIWVIAGRATIGGRAVVAGSYAYVPATVEHPIQDVGPDGCLVLQTHQPALGG